MLKIGDFSCFLDIDERFIFGVTNLLSKRVNEFFYLLVGFELLVNIRYIHTFARFRRGYFLVLS